jgi:hypothetical protein
MTSSQATPAPGPGAGPGAAPGPGAAAGSGRAGAAGAPARREVFRLAPPVALWWGWLAFIAVNVADYAVQGPPPPRPAAVIAAIMLLVTGLAYALALRPRVIADGDGLTVVNPFRVHRVPWRLITSVGTGAWVRIRYGEGRTLDCWALYVSARARRKMARPPRRAPRAALSGPARTARWPEGSGHAGGASRLPGEARYLASLPVAAAIAVTLGTRAERERASAAAGPGPAAADPGPAPAARAASGWSWPALAAVAVPALLLAAVALA